MEKEAEGKTEKRNREDIHTEGRSFVFFCCGFWI